MCSNILKIFLKKFPLKYLIFTYIFFADTRVYPLRIVTNMFSWPNSSDFTSLTLRPRPYAKACPVLFPSHFYRFSPDSNWKPWCAEVQIFLCTYWNQWPHTKALRPTRHWSSGSGKSWKNLETPNDLFSCDSYGGAHVYRDQLPTSEAVILFYR